MFISVIIPTCHRNDLLSRCLEKLAPGEQSLDFKKYEVVVTDDGSISNAQEFITKHFAWARWVKGPQKGPAANRNNGARHAKYDWLAYLDDDCIPEKDWLASYYDKILSHPEIKVLEGKTICRKGFKSPMEYAPSNTHGGFLWSCNFCIQASVYKALGGFDEGFPFPHLEDNDFKDRVDQSANRILFVEEAVVDHPARRLVSGIKLGKYQESMWYYFQHKKGQKVSVLTLLLNIFKLHVSLTLKQPVSLDSFRAFWLILEEWVTILAHYSKWNKKYPVKINSI